jgi:hypothetical protein
MLTGDPKNVMNYQYPNPKAGPPDMYISTGAIWVIIAIVALIWDQNRRAGIALDAQKKRDQQVLDEMFLKSAEHYRLHPQTLEDRGLNPAFFEYNEDEEIVEISWDYEECPDPDATYDEISEFNRAREAKNWKQVFGDGPRPFL